MRKIKNYLKHEELPTWLEKHKVGEKLNMREVLKGKTMFYPGCDIDGNPLGLLNNAHYCHVFIYVDNGVKEKNIDLLINQNNAFYGYKLFDRINLKECDLVPKGWIPHYNPSESYLESIKRWIDITESDSFATLYIFERKEEFDESHGAFRFALLYIGADANATYDALFINKYYHAPNLVFLSPNFGGEEANFDKGMPLEHIANMIDDMPEYLLVPDRDGYMAWNNYEFIYGIDPAIKNNGSLLWLYKNERNI